VQTDGQRAADRARIHGRKIAVSLLVAFQYLLLHGHKNARTSGKQRWAFAETSATPLIPPMRLSTPNGTTTGIAGCWLVPGLSGRICKILAVSSPEVSALTRDSISGLFPFSCRHCGGHLCFPSHRRTFFECYLLPLFLVRPVRCDACCQRSYQLIFTQVSERAPGPGMSTDLNGSTDNT